jgi:hypothetical protein
MTKVYDTATDLITFARSSSGTALRRVGYGDEIFGDPSFDGTGDWSLPADSVTVSGGKLTYDAVANIRGAEQNVNIYAGRVYQISFEVLSGTAYLYLSTGKTSPSLISGLGPAGYGVGVHQINVVANGNYSTIGFTLSKFFGGTACELAYFSMKEVIFDRATDDLVLFNHPDDIPRIEYGSDGSLKGLLIEEQRTNYILQSENLLDAAWTGSATVTDNGDGSFSVAFADGAIQTISQINAGATGAVNTASLDVKKDNVSDFDIYVDQAGSTGRIRYNFDTDTFSLVGSVITDYGSADVGDGWRRLWVTADGTGLGSFKLTPASTASGEERINVRRPQHELGSFATSYIPTSGSQKTRDPDIASIPVSAFGYNEEAGTIVVEFDMVGFSPNGPTGYPRVWVVDQANGQYIAVHSNSAGDARLRENETTTTLTFPAALTENTMAVMAATFADDGLATSLDGATALTATPSYTLDLPTTLAIGSDTDGSRYLNGHIKSLSYYPRRLTDAQLQELTS